MVWHLGLPKTGTTSLQELNRANSATLSDHVAVFQKRTRTRRLMEATQDWLTDPSRISRDCCAHELRRIWRKGQAWGCARILVSDENLTGWRAVDEGGDILTRLARLMPLIEEILHDADHQFVVYTRDFDAWAYSMYNQEVKMSGETRTWQKWRAALPFDGAWDAHYERLSEQVDSPLVLRDMGLDKTEGRPLGAHVLGLAGVPDEVIAELRVPKVQNPGLPTGAVEFMRLANRHDFSEDAARVLRRMVLYNPHLFSNGAPFGTPAEDKGTSA